MTSLMRRHQYDRYDGGSANLKHDPSITSSIGRRHRQRARRWKPVGRSDPAMPAALVGQHLHLGFPLGPRRVLLGVRSIPPRHLRLHQFGVPAAAIGPPHLGPLFAATLGRSRPFAPGEGLRLLRGIDALACPVPGYSCLRAVMRPDPNPSRSKKGARSMSTKPAARSHVR